MNSEDEFENQLKFDLKQLADEVPNKPSIAIDRELLFKKKPSPMWMVSKVAAIIICACALGIFAGLQIGKNNHTHQDNPDHLIQSTTSLTPKTEHIPELLNQDNPQTEYIIEKKGDLIIIEGFPPMRKVHQWNVSTKKDFSEIMKGRTRPYKPVERVRYEWQEIY